MQKLKKLFFHSPIKYVVILISGIILTIVFLIIKQDFNLYGYVNAFGWSGILLFFIGLLSLVNCLGAFDTFGYGFWYIFKRQNETYESLPDYVTKHNLKRKKAFPYIPYLVVSFLFLLVFLILYLCFISIH